MLINISKGRWQQCIKKNIFRFLIIIYKIPFSHPLNLIHSLLIQQQYHNNNIINIKGCNLQFQISIILQLLQCSIKMYHNKCIWKIQAELYIKILLPYILLIYLLLLNTCSLHLTFYSIKERFLNFLKANKYQISVGTLIHTTKIKTFNSNRIDKELKMKFRDRKKKNKFLKIKRKKSIRKEKSRY